MTEQEIKALAGMLDRVNYYRLLKIDPEAPGSELRGAYHAARRRFHPDRFLQAAPELREAVNGIARRITEAYMVLRDGRKRRAYDRAVSGGAVRYDAAAEEDARWSEGERQGTSRNGRKFYALGLQEESRGDVAKAVGHLKMALTFEPQNPYFKEHLDRISPPKKKKKS